jgi:hypothetical protein
MAFVGRKISGAHVLKRVDYGRERQGAIRKKRIDMSWIWEVFGSVISFQL